LTRFLTYITIIFLIIGIPSALAELVQPSRGQWIHWIMIASAVLAALWILRLIIWIKERREESKFPRDTGEGMNVLPPADFTEPTYQEVESDADWVVPEHGPATRPKKPKFTEHIVSEPLMSQSVFQPEEDLLSKLDKHRRTQAETEQIKEKTELIKEIKEDIRDRRQRRKWGRF